MCFLGQPPRPPKGLRIKKSRHKLLCWKENEDVKEVSKIEYSVNVREAQRFSIPSEERYLNIKD